MKRSIACLILALMFAAQFGGAALPSLETTKFDVKMEMLQDARCHITVNAEARMEGFSWSNTPVTGANLKMTVSKSGAEKVTINIEGDATFTEGGFNNLPQEIKRLNAESINLLISTTGIAGKSISELLGKVGGTAIPEWAESIVIDELLVTRFSWEGRTIKFGVTCTLAGAVLANENMGNYLPANLSISLSISETAISATASGNAGKSSFNCRGTATISENVALINTEIEAYIELPVRNGRVEGTLTLPVVGDMYENMASGPNMTLTLTVPENANVGELPSGYSQSGNSYIWSGPEAAGAIGAFLKSSVNISYDYVPPSFPLLWVAAGVAVAIVAVSIGVIVIRKRK
jgi:hypothetical protein